MVFSDLVLTCIECGFEFTFTAAERAYFAEKGIVFEPKRCLECRQNRRFVQEGKQTYGFNCTQCKRLGHVPFMPKPGSRIYCLDHYRSHQKRFSSHEEAKEKTEQ